MVDIFSNNEIVQEAINSHLLNEKIEEIKDFGFNPTAMYFGEDYRVNDMITIYQPSIQDFIDAKNENEIYDVITPFVTNTTGCRLQLWSIGIDWNTISNYELFGMLIQNVKPEYSKLIFGDVDFTSFDMYNFEDDNGETNHILYSKKMNLFLDEETVERMCKYIQYLFYTFPPEEEFTSSKVLKMDLINKDKEKMLNRSKELSKKGGKQNFLSMLSFYLNHPGTKYKKNELRNVKYFEFIYDIQRLQIYESTHALFGGMYSGFVDTKKIKQEEFNFMRDINFFA